AAHVPHPDLLSDGHRARAVPVDGALQPDPIRPRGVPRPDLLRQDPAPAPRGGHRGDLARGPGHRGAGVPPEQRPHPVLHLTMPTLAMPRPVIDLREVSLCYRLAKQKIPSFKEYALHWMRGALTYEQLWALREVNLRVDRGESLGIVGRNGAGKSTLLKVISSVLPPTRGKALVHGRVAPMLELGSGFDFELTGQENIFLNALLL